MTGVTGPGVKHSHDHAHTLEFNEATHRYKLDGRAVPGVTTFIKASLPEGEALINWRARQAAAFATSWYAGLEKHPTPAMVDTAVELSLTAYREKLSDAGNIGHALHALIELTERQGGFPPREVVQAHALRLPLASQDAFRLALRSYQDFMVVQPKLELLAAEGSVASVEHRFAGTFDRLHRVEGKIVLSDFKTSKGIYDSHLIQLGAYSLALREWHGVHVDTLEILRFGKDGSFTPLTISDSGAILELEQQAVRCRQTYEALRRIAKMRKDYVGVRVQLREEESTSAGDVLPGSGESENAG